SHRSAGARRRRRRGRTRAGVPQFRRRRCDGGQARDGERVRAVHTEDGADDRRQRRPRRALLRRPRGDARGERREVGRSEPGRCGMSLWHASVLTVQPEMFPGPLGLSLSGKALAEKKWALDAIDMRTFSTTRYGSVDDTPAGGGPGMVMRAD